MDKNKYRILSNVDIVDSGLIKRDIKDPVYKFCLEYGLTNLWSFIKVYKAQKHVLNKYDLYYFDGIVDLINLIFLNEDIMCATYLTKMIYKDNSNNEVIFKRLGFDKEEITHILNNIFNTSKERTVIEIINDLINNYNFYDHYFSSETFITKLHVISEYYNKNKEIIQKPNKSDFYELENDLVELKKFYKEYYKIMKKIVDKCSEFEEKIVNLSEDDENVKKLIKEYQEINCK